ncbi:hypothetical protein TNCV_3109141 [Trichonephila clavipes]|nr:hypothetical protein TNCV_3109141 [Trichonephila clavipes]
MTRPRPIAGQNRYPFSQTVVVGLCLGLWDSECKDLPAPGNRSNHTYVILQRAHYIQRRTWQRGEDQTGRERTRKERRAVARRPEAREKHGRRKKDG